jgi:nitrous oxidase accessory protein
VIAILVLIVGACVARADDLQALIDAAEPGATIEVGPGIYGPIKTDKPIRLIGHDWPVIDGDGASDCVLLVGGDSTIRGFVIRNSGSDLDRESCGLRVMGANTVIENNRFENVLFGIDLKQAPDCVIRDNVIGSMPLDEARRGDALRLFRSDRCLIEGNTIEDGRDALLWYSNKVTVRGNISRRNRYGFHMMFANDVTLEDNLLSDNSVGVYLMYGKGFVVRNNRIQRNRGPSGYGIGFKEVDQYEISGNLITGNCVAIYLDGSPLRRKPGGAFIRDNTIACNDIGFSFLPAVKGNTIERNNLIDNIEQLAIQGRGTAQANAVTGNHWSDYTGYDLDRDGTGDQPYVSRKLFESLVDKEPRLRLMLFSPAHDAIELIARAMPAVAPQPKFIDDRPQVAPIPMALPAMSESEPRLTPWAGMLLLSPVIALALVVRARPTRSRNPRVGFTASTGVCP